MIGFKSIRRSVARSSAPVVAFALLLVGARVAAPAQTAAPVATATPALPNADKNLSGLSVIVKVESSGLEPVFEADGYRIRIVAGTTTAFTEPLKLLSDVRANTWIRFAGKLDGTGVLLASKAEFFPAGYHKALTMMGPRKAKRAKDYQPVTKDSILDADGQLVSAHTKVRYSDAGGPCGWHRVPADQVLQERVERVGIRVVPAFQRAMAADNPSRIPFRFYAVADKARGVFACNRGLVLVSKSAIERLQNDDQLAAVLADGVAASLQRQLVTITTSEGLGMGVVTAGSLAGGIPGLGLLIGGWAADEIAEPEFQRERARIALQLLDDAGYDPWQAPEAWRLMGPKDLPKDLSTLPYTREGEYQLSLLKLQYKARNADTLVAPAAPVRSATPQQ